MFSPFGLTLPGPERQTNEPFLLLKLFLESRLSSESLESLIDFLAFLGPKPWFNNPVSDEKQKVSQKK